MYKRQIYLYKYNCRFFVCFRTYLFVRALFGKMLRRSTQEGRPDAVVEVWARSVHSGPRGRRLKFFSGGSGYDDFPGFLHETFFFFIRTYDSWCFLHGTQRQTTFRTLCTRSTDDRRRQQQQWCRACFNQPVTMLHDVPYCSQLLLSDPSIRHRG